MNYIKNYKRELEKRLRKLYIREVILAIAETFLRSFSLAIFLFILIVLFEAAGNFNSTVRTFLWYSFIILSLVTFVLFFVKNLIIKKHIHTGPDFEELSEIVGLKIPSVKDDLKNAYQLVNSESSGFSEELIEAAFKQIYDKTKEINFQKFSDNYFFKSSFKIFFPALIIFNIIFINPFDDATERIIHYNLDFIEPAKYHFNIEPGNASITKGERIDIHITVDGGELDEVNFFVKSLEDYQFKQVILAADSTGAFNYSKNSVHNSFEYFVQAEDDKSPNYKIEVIDRPSIIGLDYEIIPPKYLHLAKIVQKDNGNISALPGTSVNIKLKSDKKLKSAKVIWSDSSASSMKIFSDSAVYRFKIRKNLEYFFQLTDTFNVKSINPVIYSINLMEDAFPYVNLLNPTTDVTLGETDLITLMIKISDDYGFSALKINYKLSQSNFKPVDSTFKSIPVPFNRNEKESEVLYTWDLSELALAENDIVTFFVEVWDNDYVNGPKSSASKVLNIRVPTLDELFAQADKKQDESIDDLEETFKEAEKLREELQNISNQLKRDEKEIDWEEKEKIEQAMNKMKELENKISDIAQKMKEMQKQLEENNLLSPETLEKYNELQKLFDELTSEEMKKAMERMQNMLSQMNRNQIQQSLEDMKFNEEMLKNSMERTINLLKRIQIEQKLDEVIKRTEDILSKENELKEKAEQGSLSEEEKERLAKEQEALKKAIEKLKEEMQKLQDKMSQLDDLPNDMMKEINDEFEEQQNSRLAEETKEKIEAGDMKSASSMQQQLINNMQQMQKKLGSMKSTMQMQTQMKTMAEMMQLINELVELSKEEEELKRLTNQISSESTKFGEIAREQFKKISTLNKIITKAVNLSQKTFAITPEMGKAMGLARAEMAQAISNLQNRNSSLGIKSQTGAMKYLNEAAQQMQNAMASMMNQGQGGGMMSLMQQMQQLSQQQMSLNQMTKMMRNGKLTMEQMAQMQRLAQQQQMIQKSLEELNKQIQKSGEAKKLTGNMQKIIDEMKEVVAGLNTQKIDDDLIKTQDRILSRMLDAQRSINERDFEKNRQSVAGKEFNLKSPPEILLQTEEGRNILRDQLLRAIRQGYAKDYEELIRKYFKSLEETFQKKKE